MHNKSLILQTRKFESYAMNKVQGGNLHKEAVSFKSNTDNYIHRNITMLHTVKLNYFNSLK